MRKVDIDEGHPSENQQRLLLRASRARESAPSLAFGRDSKAGRGCKNFRVKKREGLRCALIAMGGLESS